MEQIENRIDVPVDDPPVERANSRLISDRLRDDAAEALTPVRADGWTPGLIRTFLAVLSRTGVVGDAARAAGISRQSAYALRNRAEGRAFALAWDAALMLARRRLVDDLMARAVHGSVELLVRDGRIVAERHRFDNRLSMAMLTRLDGLARNLADANDTVMSVAREFDDFVDIVCDHGCGAADFIAARKSGGKYWRQGPEAKRYEAGARAAAQRRAPAVEEPEGDAPGDDAWQVSISSICSAGRSRS